ncbi:efflux RND transporter permease subunit [Aliarcobacter lanthieri]|uniref:efflux RND transporter permease subunit n=1 Tax=Aliarcobacter lanthieri TaxID=1355374 RepID=UPI00047A56F9|nr:MMPL family transporter [Aliarcobacter lanthieri]QKF59014.1 RND superfamily transporter [Aliarcobacter lanthieri]
MVKKIYDTFIFRYPFLVLLLVASFICTLGYYSTKVQIDASAETLLLEDDEDLKFFREVYKKYENSNFLIVTFSPKEYLLSEKSLEVIKNISDDFSKVENITKVDSILTVPLLQSPIRPISDLVAGVDNMQTGDFDKELVRNEFLTSPLYKNALVSDDFKTTAIILNLKENTEYFDFLDKRNTLLEKQKNGSITKIEEKELEKTIIEFKKYRDILRYSDKKNIEEIREIIKNYEDEANIFLGGVNMIASDAIGFVKNDLLIYGLSLIIIFIFILWYIFRRIRWVFIPILICFISIISTGGVLGFFDWEVTVISSNFVALQLIITMSIVIHLIERYRELFFKYKKANQYKLVINTVLSKLMPCFLAIITTVVGFGSLVLSNIEPVINLGLMMSLGIIISLIISFILFPIILILIGKKDEFDKSDRKFSFINKCSKIVENNGKTIIVVSVITVIFSVFGASKLFVENSFINYFKKSTEIYQGMIVIDENLGGTTPLDVIIKFKDDEIKQITVTKENDDFDDFENEFVLSKDDKQYWFSQDKMQTIMAIHDYLETIPEIGKVQSLATLLKIGKTLNHNQDLDGITLALIYNQLPEEYKQLILSPYVNIDANEARITMRVIDSNPNLRRDDLLKKIDHDLQEIITNKDTTYRLSNLMVLYNNMLQSLFESQASTFGASLLVLSIMFFLIFRSSKVVFIAIVSNLIPISLVFGIMGWLGIPLDIMTITIAAIALGIAVDDTIHFIHRFEVEYKFDHNYMNAIKRAHEGIGHAMYYTTIVIVIGFSILMLSNLIPTIYFGLLTGVVMISVLIADLLLLPKMLLMLKPYTKKEKK